MFDRDDEIFIDIQLTNKTRFTSNNYILSSRKLTNLVFHFIQSYAEIISLVIVM